MDPRSGFTSANFEHEDILVRLLSSVLFFAIFIYAGRAAAAIPPQTGAAAHTKASSDLVLNESDNGKDIDLIAGSTLVVKLPGNPSTGYNWTVVGDPAPLKLQKSSFARSKTKSGMVGSSGTAIFRLSAGSSGMATLNLVYRRSWEYNVAPVKTFTVRVDVR